MMWGAMFPTPLKEKTDGTTPAPQGEVHNSNPYIFNLYRFQIDPIKTPGQVQERTLEKKTLGLVKCCGDLSSDTSHRQTDGPTSPPRGGVQLQPIYIQSVQVSD